MCSCLDCITKSFCYGASNNTEVGIKLMMTVLAKHNLVQQSDVDDIPVDITSIDDKCLLRKVELTTSFLFDLPLRNPYGKHFCCNIMYVYSVCVVFFCVMYVVYGVCSVCVCMCACVCVFNGIFVCIV